MRGSAGFVGVLFSIGRVSKGMTEDNEEGRRSNKINIHRKEPICKKGKKGNQKEDGNRLFSGGGGGKKSNKYLGTSGGSKRKEVGKSVFHSSFNSQKRESGKKGDGSKKRGYK